MGLTEDLIGTELNDLEILERIEDDFNEVSREMDLHNIKICRIFIEAQLFAITLKPSEF